MRMPLPSSVIKGACVRTQLKHLGYKVVGGHADRAKWGRGSDRHCLITSHVIVCMDKTGRRIEFTTTR
jgi:hypothetical protein